MYFCSFILLVISFSLVPGTRCHYTSTRPKTSSNGITELRQLSGRMAGYWIRNALSNTSSQANCFPNDTPALKTSGTEYHVTVGAKGALIFDPDEVDANIGDIISFDFLALNHTLTQSLFSEPCTNRGGFSTGFNQFNPKNVSGRFVVTYRVNTFDPQWFFCAQTVRVDHCRAGMVFGLNANSKMDSFISAATGIAEIAPSRTDGLATTVTITEQSAPASSPPGDSDSAPLYKSVQNAQLSSFPVTSTSLVMDSPVIAALYPTSPSAPQASASGQVSPTPSAGSTIVGVSQRPVTSHACLGLDYSMPGVLSKIPLLLAFLFVTV